MKRVMCGSKPKRDRYIKGEIFSHGNKGSIIWWDIYGRFTGTDGTDWLVLVKVMTKDIDDYSLFCIEEKYIGNNLDKYNTHRFKDMKTFTYASAVDQSEYLQYIRDIKVNYSQFRDALWARYGRSGGDASLIKSLHGGLARQYNLPLPPDDIEQDNVEEE